MRVKSPPTIVLFFVAVGLALAGCKDNERVHSDNVPKEPMADASPAMPAMSAMAPGQSSPPGTQAATNGAGTLTWTLPDGWKALPAQGMRVANFQVDPSQPDLVLTVIPLPPGAGELVANVNRWQQQLELPPSPPDQMKSVVTEVDLTNGLKAQMVDLKGNPKPSAGGPQMRILAAIVPQGDQFYFFKLAGPSDVLEKQKASFEKFVSSIRGSAVATDMPKPAPAPGTPAGALPPGHPPMGNPPTSQTAALPPGHPPMGGMPNMPPAGAQNPPLPPSHPPIGGKAAVPAPGMAPTSAPAGSVRLGGFKIQPGWTADPPNPMRQASFTIPADQKQATVIVSKFPKDAIGGWLDNVNRWRQQVGLPAVKDPKDQAAKEMKLGEQPAQLLDFKGEQAEQVVAVTTIGPDMWFFKLQGPPDAVEQQRAAFDQFLKSVEFAKE